MPDTITHMTAPGTAWLRGADPDQLGHPIAQAIRPRQQGREAKDAIDRVNGLLLLAGADDSIRPRVG
jgi:hypothetical protein